MESDPIGLQGGMNTYGYVDASPLSAIDTFGLLKVILLDPSDANYPAAAKVEDIPGVCYIISHGSSSSVNRMNAAQLNRRITKEGCTKEMPVRIDACMTGAGDNSIAEQLAKIRGTPVTAPTKVYLDYWRL